MNLRKHRIPVIVMLVALVLSTACASTSPARTGLDTLQIAKATADSAMRVCATAYAAGQLTEDQKAEAIAAYDAFAAAEITGAMAISGVQTQADADAIVASVTKTLNELLNVLRSFGVKV